MSTSALFYHCPCVSGACSHSLRLTPFAYPLRLPPSPTPFAYPLLCHPRLLPAGTGRPPTELGADYTHSKVVLELSVAKLTQAGTRLDQAAYLTEALQGVVEQLDLGFGPVTPKTDTTGGFKSRIAVMANCSMDYTPACVTIA